MADGTDLTPEQIVEAVRNGAPISRRDALTWGLRSLGLLSGTAAVSACALPGSKLTTEEVALRQTMVALDQTVAAIPPSNGQSSATATTGAPTPTLAPEPSPTAPTGTPEPAPPSADVAGMVARFYLVPDPNAPMDNVVEGAGGVRIHQAHGTLISAEQLGTATSFTRGQLPIEITVADGTYPAGLRLTDAGDITIRGENEGAGARFLTQPVSNGPYYGTEAIGFMAEGNTTLRLDNITVTQPEEQHGLKAYGVVAAEDIPNLSRAAAGLTLRNVTIEVGTDPVQAANPNHARTAESYGLIAGDNTIAQGVTFRNLRTDGPASGVLVVGSPDGVITLGDLTFEGFTPQQTGRGAPGVTGLWPVDGVNQQGMPITVLGGEVSMGEVRFNGVTNPNLANIVISDGHPALRGQLPAPQRVTISTVGQGDDINPDAPAIVWVHPSVAAVTSINNTPALVGGQAVNGASPDLNAVELSPPPRAGDAPGTAPDTNLAEVFIAGSAATQALMANGCDTTKLTDEQRQALIAVTRTFPDLLLGDNQAPLTDEQILQLAVFTCGGPQPDR